MKPAMPAPALCVEHTTLPGFHTASAGSAAVSISDLKLDRCQLLLEAGAMGQKVKSDWSFLEHRFFNPSVVRSLPLPFFLLHILLHNLQHVD
jgi:hypothetical protein